MTRAVVVGLDGLEPSLVEPMVDAGALPHLAELRRRGGYARLATTHPPQTPVAWSTFATGAGPGVHGIFDFLTVDAATGGPKVALFDVDQASRFLPPRAVNMRGGTPLWSRLEAAGVPSVVLRHPCTFPPGSDGGRVLAGVGVPDLRGGFGVGTAWVRAEASSVARTAADRAGGNVASEGGARRVAVESDAQGSFRATLPAPLGDAGRADLPLRVRRPAGGPLRIEVDGTEVEVEPGAWSPWVKVVFKPGMLQRMRGQVRFFAPVDAGATLLYASPLHYDPKAPVFPISHPWDLAGELEDAVGRYHTLGMAEDHGALEAGFVDEAGFLDQCREIVAERRAMTRYELARLDEGLLFVLHDTPDRVAHMLWRGLDPDHPANRTHGAAPHLGDALRAHYRDCDEAVGEVLAMTRPDDLVVVLSDHGFAPFRRALDLNRWLVDAGYLVLRADPGPVDVAGPEGVDWDRTRAWAAGMAGIHLNTPGRGPGGVVSEADAPALAAEIAGRLTGLVDPEAGGIAVTRAWTREALWSGPRRAEAPHVSVGCARGWRVASHTALAGTGPALFSDNTRRWSGDHVMDPEQVPGVLFMNRPFDGRAPHLRDLAPTLLQALGVPLHPDLEGRTLLP